MKELVNKKSCVKANFSKITSWELYTIFIFFFFLNLTFLHSTHYRIPPFIFVFCFFFVIGIYSAFYSFFNIIVQRTSHFKKGFVLIFWGTWNIRGVILIESSRIDRCKIKLYLYSRPQNTYRENRRFSAENLLKKDSFWPNCTIQSIRVYSFHRNTDCGSMGAEKNSLHLHRVYDRIKGYEAHTCRYRTKKNSFQNTCFSALKIVKKIHVLRDRRGFVRQNSSCSLLTGDIRVCILLNKAGRFFNDLNLVIRWILTLSLQLIFFQFIFQKKELVPGLSTLLR